MLDRQKKSRRIATVRYTPQKLGRRIAQLGPPADNLLGVSAPLGSFIKLQRAQEL